MTQIWQECLPWEVRDNPITGEGSNMESDLWVGSRRFAGGIPRIVAVAVAEEHNNAMRLMSDFVGTSPEKHGQEIQDAEIPHAGASIPRELY